MINKLKVDGRLVFNSCLYGNASCHEVELPENDHETGESIQVWTGQRRNKVLQSVNPDPPHVREKSELGSRNRVHRDNNQVITGHRGQMLQYYEKGIVLGEVIQFTEEI